MAAASDRAARTAARLLAAHRTGAYIGAFAADEMPASDAEAYAVQAAVTAGLGDKPGGWKALVYPDGSFGFAPMLSRLIRDDGATLSAAPFARLGIELELGFRFARAVPAEATPDQILAAIDSTIVTFELCETRLGSLDGLPRLAALADFANNRGAVTGTRLPFDRKSPFKAARAELIADGRTLVDRTDSHPTGDALGPLMMMPRVMAEHGRRIEAGQLVITGSLVGIEWVRPPARIEGRVSGFGRVGATLQA